jgi:hypothetical protein
MSTQPKALYLAEVIEADPLSKSHHDAGAAELRRLHAVNAELLWALKWLCEMHSRFSGGIWDKSRAAIAKAEDV